MNNPFGAIHRLTLKALLLISTALVLAACAEVNQLRDAQTTFNETAVLDKNLQENVLPEGPLGRTEAEAQVRSGYAAVLASLDFQDDQVRKLKSDGLYGNALILESLAYWRLGDFDRAIAVADSAMNLPKGQIFPRDKSVASAMRGLIQNSQARAIIDAPLPADVKEKNVMFEDANKLLDASIETLESQLEDKLLAQSHPLRAHWRESILAVFKNKKDSISHFKGTASPQSLQARVNDAMQNYKQSLCNIPQEARSGVKIADLLTKWRLRLSSVNISSNC